MSKVFSSSETSHITINGSIFMLTISNTVYEESSVIYGKR